MEVYLAWYNPFIFESEPTTISIHLTEEGAERAIAIHKVFVEKEYQHRPSLPIWRSAMMLAIAAITAMEKRKQVQVDGAPLS